MLNRFRSVVVVVAVAVLAPGCPRTEPPPPEEDAGPGPTGPAGAGLQFSIAAADIPEEGLPTVDFRVTDAQGAPVDLLAEIAAQTLTPRFTLAQLEPDFDYASYYLSDVTGRPYLLSQPDGGPSTLQPALTTTTQAIADPPSPFPTERLEPMGDGRYRYTFSEPTRRGDRALTHTVGMWGRRTFENDVYPASATFDFVPAGGAPQRVETVLDQACNTCHGILEAHDNRRGTQLCHTCHNPGSTDPESGNTVDFKVMVHKLHRGEDLPSVATGGRYYIVGFNRTNATPIPASSVFDFSHVAFPRDIRNCATCHQGAQAGLWKTNPSAEACGSCHDNVSFSNDALPVCTGASAHIGDSPCKHEGGLNLPATTCALCHTPQRIEAVHVNPVTQALPTFALEILEVTNTAPGQFPVVKFRVTDPTTGGTYDLKPPQTGGGADAGQANPDGGLALTAPESAWTRTASGDSRLFVDLAWPAAEYTNEGIIVTSRQADGGVNPVPGSALQIDALARSTPNGDGTYSVVSPTAIPAGVAGSGTAVLEGHPAIPDPRAPGRFFRVPVTNAVKYFAITDAAPQARRQIVSVENCNACHEQLTAHGNNRNGTAEGCPLCHNPNATDRPFRASYAPGVEQPIDFKVLIHEVHASKIRNTEAIIIGRGGSRNRFPIGFPGQVGNCRICHVGESFTFPLQPVVLGTTVDSLDNTDPSDNVREPAMKAVCLSCHDSVRFTGTAATCTGPNTPNPCTHSGGAVGDNANCTFCHVAGQPGDVSRVHPIQ